MDDADLFRRDPTDDENDLAPDDVLRIAAHYMDHCTDPTGYVLFLPQFVSCEHLL